MITEVLAQIRGANFTAGIVLFGDKVVETAPLVRCMRAWSRQRVREHCAKYGWPIAVVHEKQRESVTTPVVKPGIVQHEESFEVTLADGSITFFYFDEHERRRATTGGMSKEAAFAKARAHLKGRT